MIQISDSVKEILSEDGFVIETIQRGIFNLSAYAKQIHQAVEEKTMKSVALGTIVVALTRLISTIKTQPTLHPKVEITSLSVTSGLSEITYEKTEKNKIKLSALSNSVISTKEFFTVTEVLYEITIICSDNVLDIIINYFAQDPKITISDLVAVSVRFSPDYIETPNIIYSLVSALATKHINIIEVVSSFTELSFIVRKSHMEQTIRALDAYSRI